MSAAKEKAAWVLDTPETAQQNTHTNFTPDQNRLANIVAQMAVAGHAVHELEHGFLVCRWGMTRHCPDLAALVGFARQLGVQS